MIQSAPTGEGASETDYAARGAHSVPRRVILGPGPSSSNPRVLRAMSQPIVGYLDPAYFDVLASVQKMLRHVFGTQQTTMTVAGSGSAGMEAGLTSILSPGDKVVVCVNGFFCERQVLMCERLGVETIRVDAEWGRAIDPLALDSALAENPGVTLVSAIHAETSVGVLQDISRLSEVAHRHGAMFMTDVVTSLAGTTVEFDAWYVDFAYGASQKCLAAPPGISPVAISDRALEHIRNRATKPSSWYLDLALIADYWGEDHVHHHTSPVSMMFGLREALSLVFEEGLETRILRHERVASALRAGLDALGLKSPVESQSVLNQLTVIELPAGIDDAVLRAQLLAEYSIEVGRGLGQFAGRVIRVGLMGESCVPANVFALLNALETLLPRQGYAVTPGAATSAASESLVNAPAPVYTV